MENIKKLFEELIADKNENSFDDYLLNFLEKTDPERWKKEQSYWYLETHLPIHFIIEQFGGVDYQVRFRPLYMHGKMKGEQIRLGSFSFEKCPSLFHVPNAHLIVGEAVCRYYFSILSEKNG